MNMNYWMNDWSDKNKVDYRKVSRQEGQEG